MKRVRVRSSAGASRGIVVTFRAVLMVCAISAAASSEARAQRGGMGGGGGLGGGGGRGGGRGAGFGSQESPLDRVKQQLKDSDQLEFLDKKKKQIELTKDQKSSMKSLHKEMQDLEKPILKDLEQLFAQAPRGAGGRGRGADDGGSGRGAPAGVQEALARLNEIQDVAGERAHAMLNDKQKHISDSLYVIYKADLRDKDIKEAQAAGQSRR